MKLIDYINLFKSVNLRADIKSQRAVVYMDGEPNNIHQSLTVLYNYGALANYPETDNDSHSVMVETPRKFIVRGLYALFIANTSEVSGRVILRSARCLRRIKVSFAVARFIRSLKLSPIVID